VSGPLWLLLPAMWVLYAYVFAPRVDRANESMRRWVEARQAMDRIGGGR